MNFPHVVQSQQEEQGVLISDHHSLITLKIGSH